MVAIGDTRARLDHEALVLERIATHAPLDETLDLLVSLVEAQLPGSLGSLLLLDPATRTLHAGVVHSLPASYNEAIEGVAIGPSVGSCGTAAYFARPVFVSDIATDPHWAAFRDLARQHQLAACWSTPVIARREADADTVLGTFALYFRTPRVPDVTAETVLTRAAALATIAIDATRARAELRDGEARFRALVDHATDGLFVHDRLDGGRIVDVNRQACESLGYARDELIGALPALFDQDVAPATVDEMVVRLGDGETAMFRTVHRRKDGSRFPVEVRVRSFTSKGRTLNLALARDISARAEIEEQLRHGQKMEAIGRLAGGVAHDFNNLLTVIVAHAEGVLPTLAADDPRTADLEAIRDAGLRGASLTAQLLAFSRRAIIAPERVDVSALVARLGRMLERLLGETIALTTILASGDAQVSVDPGLLEQVLINLVVNARDAMPRGGSLEIATARAELAADTGDGPPRAAVRLTVTDSGIGMTDDVKARLFEPFFSTRPVGEASGLGLATCYGIVTQAGGTIRIDSEPGKGTRAEVLLPMLAPLVRPPISSGPGGETILYVEDEDAVRRVTTRSLERWGYHVISARDGLEALALEARHAGPIDLLLTDVVMPGMGGRALADQLKARRPSVAIVFMSGYTDDEVVREGVNTGVDAFVQKPFTLRALSDRLRAILDEAARATAR